MNFRFGEHYYMEGASSFWESLSIAVIGALIGILGALAIFNMTIRRDRRNAEQNRRAYLRDRLLFVSLLLEDVILNTTMQLDRFVELGKKITNSPYEISLPSLIASQQMERLKSIDSQDIFQSFTLFLSNSNESLSHYKNFLGRLDFIDQRMKQMFESNEKHIRLISEFRIRLKNLSDSFYSMLSQLQEEENAMYEQYFPMFSQAIEQPQFNIEGYYNNICIPMLEELATKQPTATINLFRNELRNITTTIDSISSTNLFFVKTEIDDLVPQLEPQLIRLDEFNQQLKASLSQQ